MSLRLVQTVWALPTTAVGLVVGGVCTLFGSRWRVRGGVLECYGGGVGWLLEHGTLLQGGALAMTLGEVVLGRTEAALDLTREHEHVHVAQARRWGVFFIPAYLLASGWVWMRGGRAYRDNPFEREAYAVSDVRGRLRD